MRLLALPTRDSISSCEGAGADETSDPCHRDRPSKTPSSEMQCSVERERKSQRERDREHKLSQGDVGQAPSSLRRPSALLPNQ
jgi:hypothetical protein